MKKGAPPVKSRTKQNGVGQSTDLGPSQLIYVPCDDAGYLLGRVVDIGTATLTVELIDEEGSGNSQVKHPHAEVLAALEAGAKDVDDNCEWDIWWRVLFKPHGK